MISSFRYYMKKEILYIDLTVVPYCLCRCLLFNTYKPGVLFIGHGQTESAGIEICHKLVICFGYTHPTNAFAFVIRIVKPSNFGSKLTCCGIGRFVAEFCET